LGISLAFFPGNPFLIFFYIQNEENLGILITGCGCEVHVGGIVLPNYKFVCSKPDVMKPNVVFNDEVCYLNVDSTST